MVATYPLRWPADWRERTRRPTKSRYQVTLEQACKDLLNSLGLMHARDVELSTNVPGRGGSVVLHDPRIEPVDRGVAVYWVDRTGRAQVMACDQWDTVRGNVRAIGCAVEALRCLDRCGAGQVMERLQHALAALPPSTTRPWRVVLGLSLAVNITPAQLKSAYAQQAFRLHPDYGGTHDQMVELNQAMQAAQLEMGLKT